MQKNYGNGPRGAGLPSGGLCSQRPKQRIFTDTRYPRTPQHPCSTWINTALHIPAAELPSQPAALHPTTALSSQVPGENLCYGAAQCLNSLMPHEY